jgi:hypothetical protein
LGPRHANLWYLSIPADPQAAAVSPLISVSSSEKWRAGCKVLFLACGLHHHHRRAGGILEKSLIHPHFTEEETEAQIGRRLSIVTSK